MVYEKFAEAIVSLTKKIHPEIIMPIGFDGAVIYHLLKESYTYKGINIKDQLPNTTELSSRAEEFDFCKLNAVLEKAVDENKPVYGLDMRTKTGSLGRTIQQAISNWEEYNNKKVDFKYTVLFGDKADISACPDIMSDEERSNFFWVDSIEKVGDYVKKDGEKWIYNVTHENLARLKHVSEINSKILQCIILED